MARRTSVTAVVTHCDIHGVFSRFGAISVIQHALTRRFVECYLTD
jgi:hypothetical protein